MSLMSPKEEFFLLGVPKIIASGSKDLVDLEQIFISKGRYPKGDLPKLLKSDSGSKDLVDFEQISNTNF